MPKTSGVVTAQKDDKLYLGIECFGIQEDFINDTRQLLGAFGGIRSGKTHVGTMKSLKFCLEHPHIDGIVTAPDYGRIMGATLPKYREVFPNRLIHSVKEGQHPELITKLGNHLYFRSTTDPQTLRAYEAGFAHVDEGAYSPWETLPVLQGRMSQCEDWQIWVTTTPNIDNPLNWVYAELVAKGDIDNCGYYFMNTLDNPYLPESYKQAIVSQYSGDMQRIELEGQFVPMGGNCFFDTDILTDMYKNIATEPIDWDWNKDVKIFRKPAIGRRYVAGFDTAEGKQAGDLVGDAKGNPDFNCCRIRDFGTGEDVAELHSRRPLDESLKRAAELMQQYNHAYCGIEINFNRDVARRLIGMGYPERKLFRWKQDEYGWLTHSGKGVGSRMDMLNYYEQQVRNGSVTMYGRDCIMEHFSFIRNRNGRPEGARNAHDDYVIAGAISESIRLACPSGEVRKLKPKAY